MIIWWILGTALLLGFSWWFVHRDPDRYSQPLDGWVSPADGVVSRVMEVSGDQKVDKGRHGFTHFAEDFPDARYIVVITLRIWDVHTQRAPNAGRVVNQVHKPGTYLNAVFGDVDTATVENEHLGLTIAGKKQCRVYMVAGLVARRIVPIVGQSDRVQQGSRIARIKLGSQCVLVLPECELKVSVGDKVYGGLTEVAK